MDFAKACRLTEALHRTAAPMGSRAVRVTCQRLLQSTGRFRPLSFVVESGMKQKETFEYWQRVGRHMNHRRAVAWFLGINLPIAIGLSLFITWHNELVGEPTPMHLLMRAAIALAAFSAGLILCWHKTFKPAIRAERVPKSKLLELAEPSSRGDAEDRAPAPKR